MAIEDTINRIEANFDKLVAKHQELIEKYKQLTEDLYAAALIVCEVADAEVYHDSQGAMLIVKSGDELIAKALAVLAQVNKEC